MSSLSATSLLKSIIRCQKIAPVYRGWDLNELKPLRRLAEQRTPLVADNDTPEEVLLLDFQKCFTATEISITKLCKFADRVRQHFSMPTVEELNPEIATMRNALRAKAGDPNSPFARFAR